MRESKLYKQFLRENLLILVLPALLFAFAGYIYQIKKPTIYSLNVLYEVQYSAENIAEKNLLADELVGLIRSTNLQGGLGLDKQVAVNSFKLAPLSIKVEVSSQSTDPLEKNLNKIEEYLARKAKIEKIGNSELTDVSPNPLFGILIGILIGFSLGLVVSLTSTYLKKY